MSGDTGANDVRVAVVHDYLTQAGGAERVVQVWARCLRPESISTLVWDPAVLPAPVGTPIFTSWLQGVGAVRRDPRLALPLLPLSARRLPIPTTSDVILVSSSGFAHGVRSSLPKVVYWHTPARWLHAADDYRLGLSLPARIALRVLRPYLMREDRLSAASATIHLCNSTTVRDRLSSAYGVQAKVIYPPVEPLAGPPRPPGVQLPERYFLTVGRTRGYKNTNLVIEAAELAGVAMISVGGSQTDTVGWSGRHLSLGHVSDAELKWLYGHAEALVSASREDFGLTPIEANLEGTPALVAEAGGFLDTVKPNVNGTFFAPESIDACAAALRTFRGGDFSRSTVRAHAESHFSTERHIEAVRTVLLETVKRATQPRENPTVEAGLGSGS